MVSLKHSGLWAAGPFKWWWQCETVSQAWDPSMNAPPKRPSLWDVRAAGKWGRRKQTTELLREAQKVQVEQCRTYYPWEFMTLCRLMVIAAEATGDWVCLLESKTHGIQWVAPAADHPLKRETKGRRKYIQMALANVTPQHRCNKPRAALGLNTDQCCREHRRDSNTHRQNERQRMSLSFGDLRALWTSHYV